MSKTVRIKLGEVWVTPISTTSNKAKFKINGQTKNGKGRFHEVEFYLNEMAIKKIVGQAKEMAKEKNREATYFHNDIYRQI